MADRNATLRFQEVYFVVLFYFGNNDAIIRLQTKNFSQLLNIIHYAVNGSYHDPLSILNSVPQPHHHTIRTDQ